MEMGSLWQGKTYLWNTASLLVRQYVNSSFRSLKRGTVSLCRLKGCKVMAHQTLRIIQSYGIQTLAASKWFDSGRPAEFFSNLQLWQLLTLLPFDPQRFRVPLWKDINLLYCHGSILKISFALSKWPHNLHSAYVIGILIFIATALSRKI